VEEGEGREDNVGETMKRKKEEVWERNEDKFSVVLTVVGLLDVNVYVWPI
jgi:hypothetical protein